MSNPNAISIEPTAKPAKPSSSSNKRKGAPTGPPQIRTTNDDGSLAPVASSSSDPAAKKQKKFFKHRLPEEERPEKEEKEVGVSKLKAGLRQAKRFLAKEGLTADVKIETERKVKSLQADLDRALVRNEEKKNAAKYHMVKFFERQKLIRRLKPLLKTLSATAETDAATLKTLNQEILDLRVGLNYVLNYPNSQKYISLFPPSSSKLPETEAAVVAVVEKEDSKALPNLRKSKSNADETDKKRSELVERIKGLMVEGKLSSEPELEILHDASTGEKRKRSILDTPAGGQGAGSGEGASKEDASGLAGDDFFGGDESD
ncbi:hypothetical protein BDY24DRAFT_388625 [Mrakia frigida]|uniref:Efg1p n=1 Tax=Mrakia frigida TaxID=29902 RepID=UPI003FCBF640